MQKTHAITSQNSYWMAVILALLAFSLLALTSGITTASREKSIPVSFDFFIDKQGTLDFTTVSRTKINEFKPFLKQKIGVTKDVYWFNAKLSKADAAQSDLFEVIYPLVDHIDIWFVDSQTQKILASHSAGDSKPFDWRSIKNETFLFPVPDTDKPLEIYLRAQSKGPLKVSSRLWNQDNFTEYSGAHKLFLGVFFGYMLAMAISNLFIFATTKKSVFGIYFGYVVCFALTVATLHGVAFRYFWPDNIWLQERAILILASGIFIFFIQFAIQILELKHTSSKTYLIANTTKLLFGLILLASLFLPYSLMITTILVLIAVTTPIVLVTGILLAFKGVVVARFFTAAWAVLLVSATITTLENLAIYQPPVDSSYVLMVGGIIETILLAFALALSFNSQFKETQTAKALATENERQALKAKDELLQVQEEAKHALEYKVEERTLELEIALRELSDVNKELEQLSAIDPLTNLMNRRFFDKRLLAEVRRSRRERTSLSVAVVDIDHFKKVNDQYGHLAGDECLRSFAKTLTSTIKRPADVICRYGGEEFVVLLPNTDFEGASKLMEKLRLATLNAKTEYEGTLIPLTISVGVTTRIVAIEDEKELMLAYADKLLYQAKQNGRNQVVSQVY